MGKFFSRKKAKEALKAFSGKKKDGIMVFFPTIEKYLSVAFGDGTNDDTLEKGSVGYLYLNSYTYDGICYNEDDGGILEFNAEKAAEYDGDVCNAVFDAAEFLFGSGTSDVIPSFVPIQIF